MQVQSVSPQQPVSKKQSTAKKIAGVAGKTIVSAGVGLLAAGSKLSLSEAEKLKDVAYAVSDKENFTAYGKYVVETGNKILRECGHQPPKGTPAELVEKAYEKAETTFNTMWKPIKKTLLIASVATFAAISTASAIIKGVKAHKANAQDK